MAEQKGNDIEKSKRDNPETQPVKNPSELFFRNRVGSLQGIPENDDEDDDGKESEKRKAHSFQEIVGSEHEPVIVCLDQGKEEEDVG